MDLPKETDVSIKFQLIDRSSFQIKFNPSSAITEFVMKADVLFDESSAYESKKILESIGDRKKHFLLVGSDGFFQVTKKVRKLGASKEFSSHLAAVGCYTTNASLSLLGELYNKINKPAVPTKVFYSREAAEEWLFQQVKMQKDNSVNK